MKPPLLIEGRRIVLRLARPADVPAIIDFWRRNRRHLAPWSPKRPPLTAAFWRKKVRDSLREHRQDRSLRLFVFKRGEPDRIIGMVNFGNFVRGAFQACHLGYSIDAREQGKGYMTEAVGAAIAHAFGPLKMHRVMANYMPRNRRSGRVLRRLGFRIEGRAREYLLIAGRWEDHVLTSRVNRAWKGRP